MAWGEHRWHSVALFWPWLHYTLAQPQSLGTSSAKGGPEASPKTLFLLLPPQSMEPRAILKRQGMKTQWACDPGKHNPGYKRSKCSKMSVMLMSDRKPILSFKYILREVEQKFSFHPLHLQGLNQIWWPITLLLTPDGQTITLLLTPSPVPCLEWLNSLLLL